jgi:hypothetical protein
MDNAAPRYEFDLRHRATGRVVTVRTKAAPNHYKYEPANGFDAALSWNEYEGEITAVLQSTVHRQNAPFQLVSRNKLLRKPLPQ